MFQDKGFSGIHACSFRSNCIFWVTNEEKLVPYIGLPECNQTEIKEARTEWTVAKEMCEKSLLEVREIKIAEG